MSREKMKEKWKQKIIDVTEDVKETCRRAREAKNVEPGRQYDLKSSAYLLHSMIGAVIIQLDAFLGAEEETLPHFMQTITNSLALIEGIRQDIENQLNQGKVT